MLSGPISALVYLVFGCSSTDVLVLTVLFTDLLVCPVLFGATSTVELAFPLLGPISTDVLVLTMLLTDLLVCPAVILGLVSRDVFMLPVFDPNSRGKLVFPKFGLFTTYSWPFFIAKVLTPGRETNGLFM